MKGAPPVNFSKSRQTTVVVIKCRCDEIDIQGDHARGSCPQHRPIPFSNLWLRAAYKLALEIQDRIKRVAELFKIKHFLINSDYKGRVDKTSM